MDDPDSSYSRLNINNVYNNSYVDDHPDKYRDKDISFEEKLPFIHHKGKKSILCRSRLGDLYCRETHKVGPTNKVSIRAEVFEGEKRMKEIYYKN